MACLCAALCALHSLSTAFARTCLSLLPDPSTVIYNRVEVSVGVSTPVLLCNVGSMFCTEGSMFCTVGSMFCTTRSMFCTVGSMFCTTGSINFRIDVLY